MTDENEHQLDPALKLAGDQIMARAMEELRTAGEDDFGACHAAISYALDQMTTPPKCPGCVLENLKVVYEEVGELIDDLSSALAGEGEHRH